MTEATGGSNEAGGRPARPTATLTDEAEAAATVAVKAAAAATTAAAAAALTAAAAATSVADYSPLAMSSTVGISIGEGRVSPGQ